MPRFTDSSLMLNKAFHRVRDCVIIDFGINGIIKVNTIVHLIFKKFFPPSQSRNTCEMLSMVPEPELVYALFLAYNVLKGQALSTTDEILRIGDTLHNPDILR